MVRNPAIVAAEEAVAWAKAPCDTSISCTFPTRFERLMDNVMRIVAKTDRGTPIITHLDGLPVKYWSCLSRLLIMDNPDLIERIYPSYCVVLDDQAGVTWMQLQYAEVTGRKAMLRSWRHAPGYKGCICR